MAEPPEDSESRAEDAVREGEGVPAQIDRLIDELADDMGRRMAQIYDQPKPGVIEHETAKLKARLRRSVREAKSPLRADIPLRASPWPFAF